MWNRWWKKMYLFCWFFLLYARVENFLVVLLRIRVFRDVTRCCRVNVSRRFEASWYLHVQRTRSPRLFGNNAAHYSVTFHSTWILVMFTLTILHLHLKEHYLYLYFYPIMFQNRLRLSRVSVLAFGTQVRGFKPGRSRRIFKGEKILSSPSFGGEVKPSVPCRRFAACKRSLELRGSRILDEICRNVPRPRRVPPSAARGLSRRWTWRHLAEEVGTSKGGVKAMATYP